MKYGGCYHTEGWWINIHFISPSIWAWLGISLAYSQGDIKPAGSRGRHTRETEQDTQKQGRRTLEQISETYFSRKWSDKMLSELKAYPITQERVNCSRNRVSAQPSNSIACNTQESTGFQSRPSKQLPFINWVLLFSCHHPTTPLQGLRMILKRFNVGGWRDRFP